MAAITSVAFSLLAPLPLSIVRIGGLIFAGTHRNRQCSVAILVASGSPLEIITEIASRIATNALPLFNPARGGTSRRSAD